MRLNWPLRFGLFIAAMATVYCLGTSLFSAARMEPLFYPFFRSAFHTSDPGQLFHYLSVIRWTAHFMEYFVLFLLLAWLLGMRPAIALVICLLIALGDEGHQYFLPDRTFSTFDLRMDASGAFSALVLTTAIRRLRAARAPQAAVLPEETGPASI